MGLFAGGESITRQRATTSTDRYNTTQRSWDAPAEATIDGVLVAPQVQGEVTDLGRQGVPGNLTLYLPPGTDLVATDRVVVRGDTYEVDGDPALWRSPVQQAHVGVVADVRKMEG